MTDISLRISNWYYGETKEDWAGEYTCSNTMGFVRHFQLYNDIVDWVWDNIEQPELNTRWAKIGDCIYVRIRKPKDWTLFALKWGVED